MKIFGTKKELIVVKAKEILYSKIQIHIMKR